MSTRSVKRRRINGHGKQIETQMDILTPLQTKNTNSRYFLRSSTRNSKKRRFVSSTTTIQEENTKNPLGEVSNLQQKAVTKVHNSKLSKLKNTISSAFSKITKKDKENIKQQGEQVVVNIVAAKPYKKRLSGSLSERKKIKKKPNKQKYEHDAKGYIIFHKGLTMNDRYVVEKRLGKGTFSKVFACRDTKTELNERVAMKVIRNQHKYQVAARTELRILDYLKSHDPTDQFAVIKLRESSYFEMHPIFVFPLYGRSLYHYLYDNNFRPFPDSHIKNISKQIIEAVNYVHGLGIIITDLKPENIIICHDQSDRHILGDNSTYYTLRNQKVRLIDFGSAVFDGPSTSAHRHLIQTRHYRAPEVMFKFNWSYPADVWSVGCVIVELANGKMLFNTHDTIDHLNQIITAIGPIPNSMIGEIDENAYNELFHFDGKLALHRAKRSNVQCSKLKSYFHTKYHKHIYDLVKAMISWDPEIRITAADALKHALFA